MGRCFTCANRHIEPRSPAKQVGALDSCWVTYGGRVAPATQQLCFVLRCHGGPTAAWSRAPHAGKASNKQKRGTEIGSWPLARPPRILTLHGRDTETLSSAVLFVNACRHGHQSWCWFGCAWYLSLPARPELDTCQGAPSQRLHLRIRLAFGKPEWYAVYIFPWRPLPFPIQSSSAPIVPSPDRSSSWHQHALLLPHSSHCGHCGPGSGCPGRSTPSALQGDLGNLGASEGCAELRAHRSHQHYCRECFCACLERDCLSPMGPTSHPGAHCDIPALPHDSSVGEGEAQHARDHQDQSSGQGPAFQPPTWC